MFVGTSKLSGVPRPVSPSADPDRDEGSLPATKGAGIMIGEGEKGEKVSGPFFPEQGPDTFSSTFPPLDAFSCDCGTFSSD
jgi:hypothetical protein